METQLRTLLVAVQVPAGENIMKESEYLDLSNRVRISTALRILRDVVILDDRSKQNQSLKKAMTILVKMEIKLFRVVRTEFPPEVRP